MFSFFFFLRRKANREAAELTLEKLKENRKLQAFVQEAEELCDWVDEKELQIQEESTRSLPSKLQKHVAFEAELAANRERLQSLREVRKNLFFKILPSFSSVGTPVQGCVKRQLAG